MNAKYLSSSLALLLVLSCPAAFAQQALAAALPLPSSINGTVTDTEQDAIPGATVSIDGDTDPAHTVTTNDTGFFEINNLPAGTYHITVKCSGFADWHTLEAIQLKTGQDKDLADIQLVPATVMTTVTALYTPVQIATQQVHLEEQQRVLGVIPNFYVVYDAEPQPLTTKLKFQLALHATTDPVDIIGDATYAAIEQAADYTAFPQGWKGYGQRFGAAYADDVVDTFLGGAVLPSLLHQDPRYFYQGTGSTGSRLLHALSAPFICKGDNGHKQFNFSSVGGDIGAAAISTTYYPATNNNASLIFANAGVSSLARMLNATIQEFVLGKLTTRGKKN